MRTRLLIFFMWLFPSLLSASTCQNIAITINADINRYGLLITSQHLPWMNLVWLQNQLGAVKSKSIEIHQLQYTWRCPEGANFINANVDEKGVLVSIGGHYSTDKGEGLFSIDLSQSAQNAQTNSAETSQVSTSRCHDVMKQVQLDNGKFQTELSSQNLPWMQIAWLQQMLGQAQISDKSESLYQWDTFALLQQSDGMINVVGKLRVGIQNGKAPSLAQAIAELGQPKNKYSEKISQYQWQCAKDSKTINRLTVLFEDENLLSVEEKYCTDSGCKINYIPIRPSLLLNKLTTIQTKINTVLAVNPTPINSRGGYDQIIKQYNNQFQTSVSTIDQLNKDNLSRALNYYTNLSQCKPGSFQYFFRLEANGYYSSTSTIQSLLNGRCIVDTDFFMSEKTILSVKCQYSSQTLQLMTPENINWLIQNGFSYGHQINLPPLPKAMGDECQVYVNKQPAH